VGGEGGRGRKWGKERKGRRRCEDRGDEVERERAKEGDIGKRRVKGGRGGEEGKRGRGGGGGMGRDGEGRGKTKGR